jgi:hypothetical protein
MGHQRNGARAPDFGTGAHAMSLYYLYRIDDQNHIFDRRDVVAMDDFAALEKAQRQCTEYEIEIWERARFVTRVAKDGMASSKRVSGPMT